MNQGPQPDDATGRSAMTKAMWRILPLILLAYMVACCHQYAMADRRLSLALCLGCDEGCDGQLPSGAHWCVGRDGR